MWAIVKNNKVQEILKRPQAVNVGSVQHPKNIFFIWSNAKLKEFGIYPYSEENPVEYDAEIHDLKPGALVIGSDEVVQKYTKILKSLVELKVVKLRHLKNHRDLVLNSGMKYKNTADDSGVIQTDKESRNNIQGAFLLTTVGKWANNHTWKTSDNSRLAMDSGNVKKMAIKVGQRTSICYYIQDLHETAIDLLGTKTAVVNYDVTTGTTPDWPSIPV